MSVGTTLVVLPNQLFEARHFPKSIEKIIIWEHPHYFTKYRYNKLKLVMHRASMKLYQKRMQKYKIIYIKFGDEFDIPPGAIMFRSADRLNLPKHIQYIENPNFLVGADAQAGYSNKTDKFYFNNFYMTMKRDLGILPNIKSTDKENRQRIPSKDFDKIPDVYKIKLSEEENMCLSEAINYIKRRFVRDRHLTEPPGPAWVTLQDEWNIPLTRRHALHKWNYFIQYKLALFAKYQDFMYFEEDLGHSTEQYHSGISSALNIGLINPQELIPSLLASTNKNAKEAYIRQLFWREYQLYCYRYCKPLWSRTPYFPATKKLTKSWYDGTVGIHPVDYCIKKAFDTGYLHHIERLMIMGNFMLLYGMQPRQSFKWFMEFSTDSYEWVMYQNVYDMVFNVTGGLTMRRIYISSSNYILKMSNLKKGDSGEWIDVWDQLYHKFIKKNKGKVGYPYET